MWLVLVRIFVWVNSRYVNEKLLKLKCVSVSCCSFGGNAGLHIYITLSPPQRAYALSEL